MTKYKTIITDNSINVYKFPENFLMSFKNDCSTLERKEFVHYGIIGSQIINNNNFMVFIKDQEFVGVINEERYYKITETEVIFTRIENANETKYLKGILTKILKEKDFFYKNQNLSDTDFIFDEYIFNSHLFSDEVYDKFLVNNQALFKPVMFGSIESYEFPECKVSLICKRSNFGMGTRLLSRGLVAPYLYPTNNTEIAFYLETKQKTYSNIQLRGSIPLFWNQTLKLEDPLGINLPYHNVSDTTRSINMTEVSINIAKFVNENFEKLQNKFIKKKFKDLHPLIDEIKPSDTKKTSVYLNDLCFNDYIKHINKQYSGNIIFVSLLKNSGLEKNIFNEYDYLLKKSKVNHINFNIFANSHFEVNNIVNEIKNTTSKATKGLISGALSSDILFDDF